LRVGARQNKNTLGYHLCALRFSSSAIVTKIKGKASFKIVVATKVHGVVVGVQNLHEASLHLLHFNYFAPH
jgi:hypothetical protein